MLTCPLCSARTKRYPERDTSKNVIAYECRNGHVISIDVKTRKPVSVAIPFQHLKACKKCGRTNLTVISDRAFDSEQGISKLVVYRCAAGHTSRSRQPVVKQYNLPPWESEDY